MPATIAGTPTHADDERNVSDLCLAARGDASAQIRLSTEARRLVVSGHADDIIGSVDGLNFARMAAAQGVPTGLMLVAEHCAHLAKVYAECGEHDCSDDWHGQAIAALELAAENMPADQADERAIFMQGLNTLADGASPVIMEFATQWRALWAPAFSADAYV